MTGTTKPEASCSQVRKSYWHMLCAVCLQWPSLTFCGRGSRGTRGLYVLLPHFRRCPQATLVDNPILKQHHWESCTDIVAVFRFPFWRNRAAVATLFKFSCSTLWEVNQIDLSLIKRIDDFSTREQSLAALTQLRGIQTRGEENLDS